MSTEAKPLDLTGILGKVKNRISLVGVELEGGWRELPEGVVELVHDGSVFNRRQPPDIPHIGELPLGPATPLGMRSLIIKNHPHKVNATCGMHVHMSFETLWHYALLMVPEYQETMLHYLTEWAKETGEFGPKHHIWARLKGESRFCQKGFWPDVQAGTKRKDFDQNRPGHRYTVIHYCGRQNTVECRVLPMMSNTKLAVDAVQQVLDITNASLFVLGKNYDRQKLGGKLELSNGIIYEESLEAQI